MYKMTNTLFLTEVKNMGLFLPPYYLITFLQLILQLQAVLLHKMSLLIQQMIAQQEFTQLHKTKPPQLSKVNQMLQNSIRSHIQSENELPIIEILLSELDTYTTNRQSILLSHKPLPLPHEQTKPWLADQVQLSQPAKKDEPKPVKPQACAKPWISPSACIATKSTAQSTAKKATVSKNKIKIVIL
ncbi:hypothetical protein IC620_11150 [Hazenella sp. IB182357]|uniref:Uncharacterized protein n=1 Tax=Polycladospora coralii TaxID=2771432 RepID=A0A926RUF7_9BACL|nr:hypothetical protein [Polycladospora coralii]MBD1372913.1 hypothetical protein [Polycladospora coralii]MBS7531030.1 hypothetical protein [Polycladospora coralii]